MKRKSVMRDWVIASITLSLALLLVLGMVGQAQAKYPDKPIELMVIFSAGGPTDTEIRILSKYAEKILGQSIAVVNVPGAGGIVGWNTIGQRSKDGYFLTCINMPHILTFPMVRDTKFDYKSFEPLVVCSADPTVWAVRADSPFKTLQDVLDYAKKNPGKITVGTAGLYLAHHLAVLQVEKEKGVKFTTIPFKGSAKSMAALLGGKIMLLSDTLSDMLRLGDKVRVLAVGADQRVSLAPNLPTFKELGVKAYIPSSDRGVAAPAGVDPAALKVLVPAFQKAAHLPEYQTEMKKAGYVLDVMTPEQAKKAFVERSERLKALLQSLGKLKK
ncbi:MAG: tripartite tricarboxylate transporter substrate binding protein [Proteobacteria bacterium]|nr:tripartite tricarboxylate transporter substrate binding protein [Pseudomonadota bacterium]MBU4576791.1 tripartite tricarboxylate transporter substrate binding protein [Pseudomonadota bacterium]